ncbi:MAG: galactokinase [Planctomycetes bacterium]|nr:galactokinase [Planctomycetota bacterium]
MSRPPTLLAEARADFEARFGRAPAVVVQAPGRVNLLGEHTDYEGGLVLPVAVGRATLVLAAPSPTPGVRMASAACDDGAHALTDAEGAPFPWEPDDGSGLPRWTIRPRALLSVLREVGLALPACDVLLHGDLPLGAGLSSSAALGVGLCRAAEALHGRDLSPLERSRLVQRAEHAAGTPCGLMDPLVVSVAREGHALLIDCARESFWHVPLPRGVCVLVADSGARHDLSDGHYARLRAECARASAFLGVRSLSEVTMEALAAGMARLDDVHLRRVRHVVSENARVRVAARALADGDFAALDGLLRAGHVSLRDDVQCSVDAVERLREVHDALADANKRSLTGARLTGGGFGGSLVALVRRTRAEALLDALREKAREALGAEVDAFVTDAMGGVELLDG